VKHLILVILSIGWFCTFARGDEPATAPSLPTLWVIGDSTVSNPQKGMAGWGTPVGKYFDSSKIRVVNKARGGRSSRTYIAEGLWDQVVPQIKQGDFVIVQFGHNDGGAVNGPKVTGRASLPGNGEQTEATTRPSGETEIVHTFGWYMRKYAGDAKAKGATVILCSHIPRREWEADGTVQRNANSFGKWTREAAEQSGAYFLDLNEIIAKHYEQIGRERVAADFFAQDHTHTTIAGAELNAKCVIEGIKGLKDCPLAQMLSAEGQAVQP
jgi:lysophospholipase L1-like esterase